MAFACFPSVVTDDRCNVNIGSPTLTYCGGNDDFVDAVVY